MATEIWCELVCARCAQAFPGQYSRGAIPRRELKEAARKQGALLDGSETFCSEDCLSRHRAEGNGEDADNGASYQNAHIHREPGMTASTEIVAMRMAKADESDMGALLDVVNIIEQMAKGWMPSVTEDGVETEDDGAADDDRFDPENPDHCRRVIAMLLRADARGGLFRAAFGLTVLLHPKNELVDPDADHITKHPKIVRALAAQDENDAAGARHRFLLQLLLDNGVLHQDEGGTWALRGMRREDDGHPRGTGSSPEQAIDCAITASIALKGG